MANPNPSPDTRFQPGESGNPSGRPKGSVSLVTVLNKVLEENQQKVEDMIIGGIQSASEGNAAWAKLLFDRVDGPVTEKVEHSGAIQTGLAALAQRVKERKGE